MLLSGTDNHLAGLGSMEGLQSPEQLKQPGYEGVLSKNLVTFVSLLRDVGYHTYMAGKWHLSSTEDNLPTRRGFENAFALMQGGASHFDNKGVVSKSLADYRENGVEANLPDQFYSSAFYTDKLIEYIDKNKEDGKPFFTYAAYTAAHWPLQVPDEYIEKYEGVYEEGYAAIREQRLERMESLGVIEPGVLPNPGVAGWPVWADLSDGQRATEVRRMQVYAGMVEALDHHIGRLFDYLKDIGELDNTVILFMSDNGAEGGDPYDLSDNESWIPANFDNSIDNMGRSNSYIAYGTNWAQVSATPYRMYKSFTAEDGIISPMIAVYPERFKANRISDEFTTVMDIAPTILEFAGVEHPGDQYQGRANEPLLGSSMKGYLQGDATTVHPDTYVMGWELFNRRAVRKSDWKLVWLNQPWGKDAWELFNLADDPAELNDLSAARPEKWKRCCNIGRFMCGGTMFWN